VGQLTVSPACFGLFLCSSQNWANPGIVALVARKLTPQTEQKPQPRKTAEKGPASYTVESWREWKRLELRSHALG
jgi:hypothetical protein